MRSTFIAFSLMFLAGFAKAEPKVTQADLINFKLGDIVALSVEEPGKKSKLVFIKGDGSKSVVYQEEFGEESIPLLDNGQFVFTNPFLRFKMFKIAGLPSPMLIAVSKSPTATDEIFEAKIFAEVDGKIMALNSGKISGSSQDGFYIGPINPIYGSGLILWKFDWNEAHYAPHKFEINIYRWNLNQSKFSLVKTLHTEKKFESGCKALKFYNLPCRNLKADVMQDGEMNTIGIESEFLK